MACSDTVQAATSCHVPVRLAVCLCDLGLRRLRLITNTIADIRGDIAPLVIELIERSPACTCSSRATADNLRTRSLCQCRSGCKLTETLLSEGQKTVFAAAMPGFLTKNAARRAAKKRKRTELAEVVSQANRPANETDDGPIPLPTTLESQAQRSDSDTPTSLYNPGLEEIAAAAGYQHVFARFAGPRSELRERSTDEVVGWADLRPRRLSFDDDDDDDADDAVLRADHERDADGDSVEDARRAGGGNDRGIGGQNRRRPAGRSALTVAMLKAVTHHPDKVEWTDVSTSDPYLLNELKAAHNAVPVPAHWSSKREYLAGKRGQEKTGFTLPDFIRATGVGEMREAANEQRDQQSLKQQMRGRVQPKMGRLDVDYQKLHDAFFRFQTKPSMTRFGAMFYEGKEFETTTLEREPGKLSEALKEALGMPPGAPPPWLVTMQRLGPPPSYPSLKVPGLNAPLPSGAQWGYHPGGWGKPPTDEYNRPLYGDVFGTVQAGSTATATRGATKDLELWGEMEEPAEEVEEESSAEEEGADEVEDDQMPDTGADHAASIAHASRGRAEHHDRVTGPPDGPLARQIRDSFSPEPVQLRKRDWSEVNAGSGIEFTGTRSRETHQILPERRTGIQASYGSSYTYDTADMRPRPETAAFEDDLSAMIGEQAAQAHGTTLQRNRTRHDDGAKRDRYKF